MKTRGMTLFPIVAALLVIVSSGCASKKYARTQINDRVAPLERKTGELEESARRNNQDIARVGEGIQDARREADRAQSQAESAQSKADQANSRALNAERSADELRGNLDKYSLQNTATVNFRFDRYDLTPEARASLDALAAQIKPMNHFILEIQGFADSTGSDTYNDRLTQKRAEAVERYLAEQHGIPAFRMRILGMGERRPVADNSSRSGRAQNRRVEVRILVRKIEGNSQNPVSSNQ
jgi:outer membrane protein OmpA-like peptidoglycan-associated protein